MSVCLCLFICLFICLFVDYLTFLFTWASCLIQRIHTYITLSSIIRYRFAVLLQNHFFRTAYIKQYIVSCLCFVHTSVSQSVPMCVYVSVCVSVCSTAKMSSSRRRVALVPRNNSSQSDAVKIRHFNSAPEDNHDCSFSTITLPFQCTYIVPGST